MYRAVFVGVTALVAAVVSASGANASPVAAAPPLWRIPFMTCGAGTYADSDGVCVHDPTQATSPPPGATAQCRDGSYSFSLHHSGTCSDHGGVAQWLSASSPPAASPSSADPSQLMATGGDDEFVAMAVSPLTGKGGFGTAGTQDKANQIALAECQVATGDVCQVAAGMHHGCAAYAIDPTAAQFHGGYGVDTVTAIDDAMSTLPGGHVAGVHCST